ncbi:MAG: DUF4493 domain-containing protein [Muribaculaceae bacterium]|nr:DUF4493 domain-containing protein [Muribaculaceae bacterium]
MRKIYLMGLGAVVALFSSCSEDWGETGSDKNGYISPFVSIDTKAFSSRSVQTRDIENEDQNSVTVSDLFLRLKNSEGQSVGEWKYGEFPSDKQFAVGSYTLEAYYGDISKEGFSMPYYYGSQQIQVKDNETTNVNLTASLANSLVTLSYSEAFENYMADWSASINSVEYVRNEIRPAYVTPGNVEIRVAIKKPNGVSAEFSLDKVNALPRHHYKVSVDVNNGEVGDASLVVTFDEDFEEEEIVIDLSDKLLTTPKPVIDTEGFTSGSPLKVIAGLSDFDELSMSMIAMAGIKEVNLKTSSQYLLSQGWPEEINLLEADGMTQNQLTNYGLSVLGMWNTPGEMAYMDFSKVVPKLKTTGLSADKVCFEVTVKDIILRESESTVLVLDVQPVEIELSSADETYSPGELLNVNLSFNGTQANVEKDVLFQYYDKTGIWRNLSVKNVRETNGNFIVTLETPYNHNDDIKIKASCGGNESELMVGLAPYQVSVADNNVFATYAYVKVVATPGYSEPVLEGKTVVFSVRKNDSDEFKVVTSETVSDGFYKISGLDSGSNCQVRVALDGINSKSTAMTTESALGVPNGDFSVTQTLSLNPLNVGGQWTVLWKTYQTQSSIERTVPAGEWATLNPLTCFIGNLGSNTPNTWGTVPSTFIQDGAVVVRTVGYSHSPISLGTTNNSTRYYCTNTPSESSLSKSAGELFLGSYVYDGSAKRSNGVSFSSRPSSFDFSYKYVAVNNEKGYVSVIIRDEKGEVVDSQSTELDSASTLTNLSLPLSYSLTSKKAKTIEISFKSTKSSSPSIVIPSDLNEGFTMGDLTSIVTGGNILVKDANTYKAFAKGSELTVSNLKFSY